jgi:serine/threonine protein kinase/Tfp pilus assembly protein PilF
LPLDREALFNRFPQWQPQLEVLLACHQLLEQDQAEPRFPEMGESIGDFRLVSELGRGGMGRVVLATQTSLGGRAVVLKLTPLTGFEHLSLARLQHTHIVPLYGVQDLPERGLRVLCMPYFEGVTLAQVLDRLRPIAPARRTGRHLVEVLEQADLGAVQGSRENGPARKFLSQSSYVQAICWIGVTLAEALQYAHDRRLVHLDIKPSNVLLTVDGQPMLLDFHLARPPMIPGETELEWLGGTPAYVSPEQFAGLKALQGGHPLPAPIDGRSDLYSLGRILYEALEGRPADSTGGAETVPRLTQPGISVGLADIVARCLEADPARRYPSAAALAADLRCHLANQPLCSVSNRSWRERFQKWQRRHPHGITMVVLLGAVLLTAATSFLLSVAHIERQFREAQNALIEGNHLLESSRYLEARDRFARGQALLTGIPWQGNLQRRLESHYRLAQRFLSLEDLHRLAEELHYLYGLEGLSEKTGRPILQRCRSLWDRRRELASPLAAEDDNPERARRQRADLLDLAILSIDLDLQLASHAEHDSACRRGQEMIAQAETLFGPQPVLHAMQARLARDLGQADLARTAAARVAEAPPQTAWEHYALGRLRLREGHIQQAAALFNQAVEREPQAFWPAFYLGLCHYRLKLYDDAVAAFTACVALAPGRASSYFNRALAAAAAGCDERALSDYSRALALDPSLGGAWLNRGLLHYRAKRFPQALADLAEALHHHSAPATVHYNLALVYLAANDRPAARESLRQALVLAPDYKEARALQQSLHDTD